MNAPKDLYASRSFDDNMEPLCNETEDNADAIALHLAHEDDPIKAIAAFAREQAEQAYENKLHEASRDGWKWRMNAR